MIYGIHSMSEYYDCHACMVCIACVACIGMHVLYGMACHVLQSNVNT